MHEKLRHIWNQNQISFLPIYNTMIVDKKSRCVSFTIADITDNRSTTGHVTRKYDC